MTSGSLIIALVLAAVLGLVIGSFLNVVVYRVPVGIPLVRESRCPRCDARVRPQHNVPIVSWLVLRGRCAGCDEPISVRYPLVELATAVLFAAVTGWALAQPQAPSAATWLVLAAFLYLAAISIALALIDLDTHRLPDGIVLPAYLVAGALLTAAAVVSSEWDSLLRAGIGMVALYAFYATLRLIRPGGMGGGDVKLSGVLGMYLGWLGWPSLIVGAFGAFLLGGAFGVALLLGRRANRSTAIPFGPWMLVGAWAGILAGPPLSAWYLGIVHA